MEKLLFLATHRRRSFDSEESSRDSPDNNRRVEKGVEYHPPIDCEEEEEESDDTEDLITTGTTRIKTSVSFSAISSYLRTSSNRIRQTLPNSMSLQPHHNSVADARRNSFKSWGRQATVPCIIGSRYVPRQQSLPPEQNGGAVVVPTIPPLQIPSTTRSSHNRAQSSVGQIRPDLYRNLQKPEPENNNGSLTFSMHFVPSENQLRVRIIKAADLPPKDVTGTSDPYVKVQLLPETKTKYQTKVIKKCLHPSFNETFVFDVTLEELPNRMLQLTVYDFDRFTRHDFIGRVLIPDILDEQDIYSEAILTKNLTNVEGADKAELGDLMLTLVYLPSARRLTVIVVKAVNLKIMDITGASDPYVKVSLLQGGKRVRKRKTTVHRRTVNPVFNEALFFDIGEEQLTDSHLIVQVIDHDRIGRNELIGALEIGSQVTSGSGGVHWRDCIAHARKPVTMWHTLIDLRTLKRNSIAVQKSISNIDETSDE